MPVIVIILTLWPLLVHICVLQRLQYNLWTHICIQQNHIPCCSIKKRQNLVYFVNHSSVARLLWYNCIIILYIIYLWCIWFFIFFCCWSYLTNMYYNFKKFVIRDDSDLDETLDLNEDYNSEIAICSIV